MRSQKNAKKCQKMAKNGQKMAKNGRKSRKKRIFAGIRGKIPIPGEGGDPCFFSIFISNARDFVSKKVPDFT